MKNRNYRSRLLSLLLLPLFSGPVMADTQIEGFYWMLEPSGNARIGQGTTVGTQFDLKNDFGYSDTYDTPGITVSFGQVNRFGFSWLDLSMDATKELEIDVEFRDLEFRTQSTVTSTIDTQLLRGFYRLGNAQGSFRGSAEVGVLYADFEASAAASGVGRTAAQSDGATVYGGLNGELFVGNKISLAGSFRYSQFDIQGLDVKYSAYELGARYYLSPLYVGGGYRFLGLDASESSSQIDVDIEFDGYVFYAGFRF